MPVARSTEVPVGHRRFFLKESGPLEHPDFCFPHAAFKRAQEFLKQKVTVKFGQDVTIAKVSGSAEDSRELEYLRRDYSHDALRAGTIHPTEPWMNGAILFLNIFVSTIPLP